MSQRIYKPLTLSVKLPDYATVVALHHDLEGFRILLEEYVSPPTFRKFRIAFSSTPFAVRMIDEGDYLLTGGSGGGLISTVENSEYLNWFHDESQQVREGQSIKHYAIYTINECFDILHSEEPKILEIGLT